MQYYPAGKGPWPTLTLSPGQKLTGVAFKLMPQAVITGRILDEDGDPVPMAVVQFWTLAYENGKKQLMPRGGHAANDNGEFRLINLEPGRYIISASDQLEQSQDIGVSSNSAVGTLKEGHVRTFYLNTLRPSEATWVEVTAGAQVNGIEITLAHTRTARVKGRLSIVDSEQPLWNANLELLPRAGSLFELENFSGRVEDSQGGFEISGVIPGSYVLRAELWDEAKQKSYTGRMPVEVTDSNVVGLEVKLQPTMEVNGRVILEENGDLKGATLSVYLRARGFDFRPPAAEVKDLSFRLADVDLELYDINVNGMPERFYLKSIHLGQQDVTESGLDFTQGVLPGDMTMVLNPDGGQINGSVQNAKGEQAADATVTLIPDSNHQAMSWMYKTTHTDKNGRFIIQGVRPGEYKVYAWVESGAYLDSDFIRPHESSGESVSIKEGGHQTVQLEAIPSENTSQKRETRN